MVDECLFVVSWNKTPWKLVREQMDELSRHDCAVTGVVLDKDADMLEHSKYHPTYVNLGRPRKMIGTAG